MIPNLKKKKKKKILNYKYFRMESISNVISLIKPNINMASIDLSGVIFSVPVHVDDNKFSILILYFS